MRLFLALVVPWFVFFTIKRPVAGIVCLLLQLSLVGWLPAAIYAVYALGQFKTDKKIAALKQEIATDATAETAEPVEPAGSVQSRDDSGS